MFNLTRLLGRDAEDWDQLVGGIDGLAPVDTTAAQVLHALQEGSPDGDVSPVRPPEWTVGARVLVHALVRDVAYDGVCEGKPWEDYLIQSRPAALPPKRPERIGRRVERARTHIMHVSALRPGIRMGHSF
jgi:hypothetical protein